MMQMEVVGDNLMMGRRVPAVMINLWEGWKEKMNWMSLIYIFVRQAYHESRWAYLVSVFIAKINIHRHTLLTRKIFMNTSVCKWNVNFGHANSEFADSYHRFHALCSPSDISISRFRLIGTGLHKALEFKIRFIQRKK